MAALAALMLFCISVSFPYQRLPLLIEQTSFGSFEDAARMTIFPQGWVCVADRGSHSVQLFKEPTSPPAVIGGYGWQASAFDRPAAVTTDGINLLVADFGNHRIQRFDRTLSFVSQLATRDTTESRARFGFPLGVAVSRFGDLFVLDGENLRVLKFHVSGRFERSFGDAEPPPGRLVNPLGLTIGQNDRLLVVERNRIVEYDYFGNFIRQRQEEMFTDLVSVAQYDSGSVVLTREALIVLQEGRPPQRIELKNIITSQPLLEVRDVALQNKRLWLLTRRTCVEFELQWR